MKNKAIVLICDDNYVMPTIVTISSIDDNIKCENLDEKYDVYICTWELSLENTKIIESLQFNNLKLKIKKIENEKYVEKMKSVNQYSHVTTTALLKFELANLFNEYDNILYLDSDLIIKKDISPIFNIDLKDYYVAATFELWKYLERYFSYDKSEKNIQYYFNSGVMYLNLKKIREDNLVEKLWKTKIESFNNQNANGIRLMDQDTFNIVCAKKCFHLPIKYNCDTKFTKEIDIKRVNEVFNTSYKNNMELYNDVSILHYIGKQEKPWKYANVICQKDWDYYYHKSCYGDQILNRIVIKKNISYFMPKVLKSLKDRGAWKTIKYIIDKKMVIKKDNN